MFWCSATSVVMVLGHAAHLTVTPPDRFPDLLVVLVCGISCASFCVAYVYFTWRCVQLTWAKGSGKVKKS